MIAGFATEFSSNTATAHLFMPLIAQLSIAIRVNPYLLMMPMTLATSLAFMLPVATPPNAIAFSYGRIKIRDMAISGFVMNLVGFGLVTLLIGTYGKTILGVNLNSFPAWADV